MLRQQWASYERADDSNVLICIMARGAQGHESVPTTSTSYVIELPPARTPNTGSVGQLVGALVAAMLADVRASAFYSMTVRHTEQT